MKFRTIFPKITSAPHLHCSFSNSRMDSITISAASGLRSRIESLDILANNLANANTAGFKSDREFYSLYIAPEAADGSDAATAGSAGVLPVVQRPWTDFSQGLLQPTGNPLDMALSGRGFFVVGAKSGLAFTRNGSFHLASDGELVTAEGYPLKLKAGGTIHAQPGVPLEVAPDGAVRQGGQLLGQLQIVDFQDPAGLTKMGGSYFRATDNKSVPTPAKGIQVLQGKVENSNVGVAESAVRMVGIMRQFEMLQKAILLGSDIDRQSVQEVARVGA